jgi:uncharacterized protein YjiS (DUF1127 family)
MSTTVSTALQPAGTQGSGAVLRVFNDLWDTIARYLVRRAAIATLRELDDRALRDIGITRSQIRSAVDGFIVPGQARR